MDKVQRIGFDGNENADNSQEEPFIWRILILLHRYLCIFVRLIMVKLYDERGQSMPPIDDRLLLEPATSIAEKIRTKQVSAVQVITAFNRRIKQINPLLNCVVDERYKDALAEATEVDKLIASNKYTVDELRETKPFLGVPISTKDSIGVKGMIQTCGYWPRRNVRATEDAVAIRLMREAGAIPFAISNVPELCLWCESSNTIYGRTRNAYDTNRMAGGSSGGEAVLLAAAGSPFGIGSDIGGSVRLPAFNNGIFGHKPSAFAVSNKGQWAEPSFNEEDHALTIGPMSRFASDLKPMLQIMAGEKAKDLELDKTVNLSKLRYFFQKEDGGRFVLPVDRDILEAMDKALGHIEMNVGVKPRQVQFQKLKHTLRMWDLILKDNSAQEESANDVVKNKKDENEEENPYIELLKWCVGWSKHTLPTLIYGVQSRWDTKPGDPEYHAMVKKRDDLRREFDELLGDDGVFIFPTQPFVAAYHNEPIIRWIDHSYSAIFNILGLPSTAVPLGIGPTERLPVGIQVVANRNQDRLCLAVASELEQAFGGWVAPEIIA